jgi:glycerate dehydrogenase
MKIVVLDAYTLKPQEMDWSPLRALGDCTIYDRTPPAKLLSRAHDAEVLLTNKVVISREAINSLPRLAYIGVKATGTNVVARTLGALA